MSTFDDRENAFEAKFAHDQEKGIPRGNDGIAPDRGLRRVLDADIARGKRTPHSHPIFT